VENPQILRAVGVRGKFFKTRELRRQETADPHGAKAAPRDDNKKECWLGIEACGLTGREGGLVGIEPSWLTARREASLTTNACGQRSALAASLGRAVVIMSGSYRVER
jgi:hypothetical protein